MKMREIIRIVESENTRPTAADIARIRNARDEVRRECGGGGQCHEVAAWIEETYGWPAKSGAYTDLSDDTICECHFWNILPDGAILDSTADQFGEGNDIRIVLPSDVDYSRYRDEWYDDYHPGHADHPEIGNREWSGELDMDKVKRLRRERGDRWWIKENATTTPNLIYRWVDDKAALSYVKLDGMKARFSHYLPAKVSGNYHSKFCKGLSFSHLPDNWRVRGDTDICFALDRTKLPSSAIDINGQATYELGQMMEAWRDFRINPGKDGYNDAVDRVINGDHDEVFVLGNIPNLHECLASIKIGACKTKTLEMLEKYCTQYSIQMER